MSVVILHSPADAREHQSITARVGVDCIVLEQVFGDTGMERCGEMSPRFFVFIHPKNRPPRLSGRPSAKEHP